MIHPRIGSSMSEPKMIDNGFHTICPPVRPSACHPIFHFHPNENLRRNGWSVRKDLYRNQTNKTSECANAAAVKNRPWLSTRAAGEEDGDAESGNSTEHGSGRALS